MLKIIKPWWKDFYETIALFLLSVIARVIVVFAELLYHFIYVFFEWILIFYIFFEYHFWGKYYFVIFFSRRVVRSIRTFPLRFKWKLRFFLEDFFGGVFSLKFDNFSFSILIYFLLIFLFIFKILELVVNYFFHFILYKFKLNFHFAFYLFLNIFYIVYFLILKLYVYFFFYSGWVLYFYLIILYILKFGFLIFLNRRYFFNSTFSILKIFFKAIIYFLILNKIIIGNIIIIVNLIFNLLIEKLFFFWFFFYKKLFLLFYHLKIFLFIFLFYHLYSWNFSLWLLILNFSLRWVDLSTKLSSFVRIFISSTLLAFFTMAFYYNVKKSFNVILLISLLTDNLIFVLQYLLCLLWRKLIFYYKRMLVFFKETDLLMFVFIYKFCFYFSRLVIVSFYLLLTSCYFFILLPLRERVWFGFLFFSRIFVLSFMYFYIYIITSLLIYFCEYMIEFYYWDKEAVFTLIFQLFLTKFKYFWIKFKFLLSWVFLNFGLINKNILLSLLRSLFTFIN